MVILNQCKNILDDFINNSDPKSLNRAELINERSCNALIFEGSSADISEKDCLNKNLSNELLWLAPKTKNL